MSPQDALKPLTVLVRKHPSLEAQAIWAVAGEWQAQDDEDEGLDGEEIAFYAAGSMMEGYSCAWQVLGLDGPEFVRLFFWQSDMPPLPQDADVISQGTASAA